MIRHNGIEICNRTRTIRFGSRSYVFKRSSNGVDVRFKTIKHLLLCGPVGANRQQMLDLCYGDDERGGPLAGVHYFDIVLNQTRMAMSDLGLSYVNEKRSGIQYFRLVRAA